MGPWKVTHCSHRKNVAQLLASSKSSDGFSHHMLSNHWKTCYKWENWECRCKNAHLKLLKLGAFAQKSEKWLKVCVDINCKKSNFCFFYFKEAIKLPRIQKDRFCPSTYERIQCKTLFLWTVRGYRSPSDSWNNCHDHLLQFIIRDIIVPPRDKESNPRPALSLDHP